MSEFEQEAAKAKTTFQDTVRAVADDVAEALDKAVDGASDLLSGEKGNKVLGGAAIGALAAVVLPVSLVTGALLGAGYAAYRQMNR